MVKITAAQRAVLDSIPTADLKRLVANRVAADAAALYRSQEAHVSKKPSQQRAREAREAREDKAHWQRQKASGKQDPTSQATYQRAIDRAQSRIDKNS